MASPSKKSKLVDTAAYLSSYKESKLLLTCLIEQEIQLSSLESTGGLDETQKLQLVGTREKIKIERTSVAACLRESSNNPCYLEKLR